MRKPLPLQFPFGGVAESNSASSQPEGTTPVALNVRAFDQLEKRNRGGQRTGLAKLVNAQVNGSNDLQLIATQTEAVALSEDAGFGNKYANPASLPSTAGGGIAFHPDGDIIVVYDDDGSGYSLELYPFDPGSGVGARIDSDTSLGGGAATTSAILEFTSDGEHLLVFQLGVGTLDAHQAVYPVDKVTGIGSSIALPSSSGVTVAGEGWRGAAWHPDGDILFLSYAAVTTGAVSVRAYEFNGTTFTLLHTVASAAGANTDGSFRPMVACSPNGDGVVVVGNTSGDDLWSWAYSRSTGFSGEQTASGGSPRDPAFNSAGNAVVYISGTDVIVRTVSFSTGFGAAVTQASGFSSVNRVRFSPSGEYIVVVGNDTNSIFISVYPWTGAFGAAVDDPATEPTGVGQDVAWSPEGTTIAVAHGTSPFFSVYEFADATTNPSARRQRIIAVAGGNTYRTTINMDGYTVVNNGTASVRSSGVVRGVEAFQKFFFVDSTADGYVYLDYADNTIKDWESALSAGSLPVGTDDATIGCRIIALYRGRVVLAGLLEEPQNWFMSRAGDPLDFDYSPATTSAIQPVAGNNSNVGELGDVITCLSPFQDDLMVMGGVNSIWLMRGDPAAGGSIDNISRQIGIVGPDAGTWDTVGNFYFMGQNGLYRMSAGAGQPELISKGKLDNVFTSLDIKTNRIWLIYDAVWQGVHIFVIPEAEPGTAPMHYFWDERNNAFWPDQYPAAIGPACVHLFQSDDPDLRGLLMGGFDGYVRQFRDGAMDDDGTAITSRVQFAPINTGLSIAETRLSELVFILDDNSDDLTLKVFTGQTIENAKDQSNLAFSRTLLAGRNNAIRQRVRGSALAIQLEKSGAVGETWAFEAAVAAVETSGKARRLKR